MGAGVCCETGFTICEEDVENAQKFRENRLGEQGIGKRSPSPKGASKKSKRPNFHREDSAYTESTVYQDEQDYCILKAKEVRSINHSGQKQKLVMKSLLHLEVCERNDNVRTTDNSEQSESQQQVNASQEEFVMTTKKFGEMNALLSQNLSSRIAISELPSPVNKSDQFHQTATILFQKLE